MEHTSLLAQVYAGLAEALAAPMPGWLSAEGRGWPLYGSVLKLASRNENPLWQEAILKIAEVRQGGIHIRQEEYREIFHPCGGAPIGLYECQHVDGRFPGPATFAVKNIYALAGLAVEGAEMPDHAAVELAFLAHLCEQEARGGMDHADWCAARRLFIQNHAGKWLPRVGRALLRSGFPAWAALGQVLVACQVLTPVIADVARCNLCGFCVQVCPTQALRIHEDDEKTELWLLPGTCVACHKCEQVCETGALMLSAVQAVDPVVLRRSDRAHCPYCGAPTVSRAELEAVAARLGKHPAWLDACLACR